MKQIVAFFDVDGTLYRESLIKEVFKKLVRYGVIDGIRWHNDVKPKFSKYDNRTGDYDDYLLQMHSIYNDAITHLSPNVLEFITKQVIEEKGGRVYRYTRDRILWHKQNNHKIITISGSPIELVKEISARYEIDDYRGTIFLHENNKYTGDLIPMWDSQSKQKAIEELTEKYNLDLENSYAYGDTSGDFTMFKLVGHPTCINPTKELLDLIENDNSVKSKIKIIVERKNVIYSLKPEDIMFE